MTQQSHVHIIQRDIALPTVTTDATPHALTVNYSALVHTGQYTPEFLKLYWRCVRAVISYHSMIISDG